MSMPRERRPAFAALLLFGALYLAGYIDRGFWTSNEGTYSLGARSVLEGHFLLPELHDGSIVDKPPLYFWWVAVVSLPFGDVTEWSARLSNWIPALAILWGVFLFGRRVRGGAGGLLAMFVTGSAYEFWQMTLGSSTDMAMTATLIFAWIALYSILNDAFTWRRWLAFWGLLAAGMLIKGPVVVALSGLCAVFFAAWRWGAREGWRRLWTLRPARGLLVAMAPFALWAAAVWAAHGYEPFRYIVIEHNFIRFLHAEQVSHVGPWYYFFKETPLILLPWTLLAPLAALELARSWRVWKAETQAPFRFALSAGAAVFLFFTVSSGKRDYYLLPLVPWFGLVIGLWLESTLDVRPVERLSDLFRRVWSLRRGRVAAMLCAGSFVAAAAYAVVGASVMDVKKSPLELKRAVEAEMKDDAQLLVFNEEDSRILYYMPRGFRLIEDTASHTRELENLLRGKGDVVLLMEDEALRTVRRMNIPLWGKRLFYDDERFFLLINRPPADKGWEALENLS